MTKKLCGSLIQRQPTKWPAIANRFVTPEINSYERYFSALTKKLHTLLRWCVTWTFLPLQVGQYSF